MPLPLPKPAPPFLAVLCCLLLVPGLRAQDVRLHGSLEVDHLAYYAAAPGNGVVGRSQGLLRLEGRARLGRHAAVFTQVEGRMDRAAPTRDRVFAQEAYLDLYLGPFDVRLGRQIHVWGRADGFNPTDHLNPFDYTDLLDTEDERLGVTAARVAFYAGRWTLEGIVAPWFSPSRLPRPGSRWFPALPPRLPHPLDPAATVEAAYRLAPAHTPQGAAQAQYAARAEGTAGGWDFALSLYHGWNDLPAYRTAAAPAGPGRVRIDLLPEHHRLTALGGDFATTAGPYGLRGEVAWRFTGGAGAAFAPYVLGVDRTFGSAGSPGSVFVLLQWMDEVGGGSEALFDLNHLFRRTAAVRADYRLTARLTAAAEGLARLEARDYAGRLEAAYQMNRHLDLRVATDLLGGRAASFFGSLRANDRLQVRVRYRF